VEARLLAVNPPRNFAQITQVQSNEGVVRACPLAGRAAGQVGAQIAFGRFDERLLTGGVDEQRTATVADFNHLNVIIRATLSARAAADASAVVDPHDSRGRVAGDGAGRAANHAHRIDAVHARLSNHQRAVAMSLADEARVVVVGGSARADAVVASGTAVEVDDHRLLAVDEAVVDEEFEKARVDAVNANCLACVRISDLRSLSPGASRQG